MTTTETSRDKVAWRVFAALGVAAVLAVLYGVFSRPPQMGTSEEAFKTVDALYTAVRGRDEKRLGECEARLHAHRDAGKLTADAAGALDAIIRKARSGSWDTATERLYEFMLAQRREGPIEHHHHEHVKAKPPKTKGK